MGGSFLLEDLFYGLVVEDEITTLSDAEFKLDRGSIRIESYNLARQGRTVRTIIRKTRFFLHPFFCRTDRFCFSFDFLILFLENPKIHPLRLLNDCRDHFPCDLQLQYGPSPCFTASKPQQATLKSSLLASRKEFWLLLSERVCLRKL